MAQGSTGNVISAPTSFVVPGLGQFVRGRVLGHIVACLDAAVHKGNSGTSL